MSVQLSITAHGFLGALAEVGSLQNWPCKTNILVSCCCIFLQRCDGKLLSIQAMECPKAEENQEPGPNQAPKNYGKPLDPGKLGESPLQALIRWQGLSREAIVKA